MGVEQSLLVGEVIVFTDGLKEQRGLVMGVETIKHTILDIFPTTGYCVLNESKELKHVPYHKVVGIVEPDIVFLELLVKEGDMVHVTFPKYQKPEHPKAWEVDNETNNDLPF